MKIILTLIYNFLGPIWSILEAISPNFNLVLANFNLFYTISEPIWSTLGQIEPILDRFWANMIQFLTHLGDLYFFRMSVQ